MLNLGDLVTVPVGAESRQWRSVVYANESNWYYHEKNESFLVIGKREPTNYANFTIMIVNIETRQILWTNPSALLVLQGLD